MPDQSYSTPKEGTPGSDLLFQKIFEAQQALALVLSPDLLILAATDMYLKESLTVREEILGRHVLDVFPDAPDSTSSATLKASFQEVLSTGKRHIMAPFRFDIPDPQHPGTFLERYWLTTNIPILNEQGEIIYLIHETVNVTESTKAALHLKESQEREQTALAQAEHQRVRLERLFNQAPAGMAMLEGPDLVYKVVNHAYQQLFPGRELMGLPVFSALPELKDQPIEAIMRHVYTTGETFEGKEVLVPLARFEGEAPEDIYWNFIYQAIFDARGRVNGILIFALDVTEFVKARQQVEKSAQELKTLNHELEERVARRTNDLNKARAETERQRQRLETLFMNAPAAICILDGPELVYELVNPGYAQLFPGRQLLGKPILEALPEIKDNEVYKTFMEVYRTGIPHEQPELLVPFVNPVSGKLEDRYFRYVQQARQNEHGQIDGILVFALEVTEQVEARQAVEASARQLRLVTDSLPVLIGYVDREERYRFANKAYEHWFPVKAEALLGKKVQEVIGDKAYAAVKSYIDQVLAGKTQEFEITMPYRDDFTRHIHTSYVPDVKDGVVIGFYTLVTDATEQIEARKKVEKSEQEAKAIAQELATANEELRLTNQQLTHTNIDLDNFIYTASHDLRGPISNIEMLMRELQLVLPAEDAQNHDVGHILTLMKGSIERFIKTISNLTEITKLQKDNSKEATLLNLEEMVEEVKLDLGALIKESGAQVETRHLGHHKISFSEKNLRSIIYNLLSNAIKYRHPDRPPVVQISTQDQEDYLVLTVQDNGLGLNATQLSKLYTMFRRFHDHVEGSGVGLYMVKRIVDNAGGKIEVESSLGEGTQFKVFFKK